MDEEPVPFRNGFSRAGRLLPRPPGGSGKRPPARAGRRLPVEIHNENENMKSRAALGVRRHNDMR